MTITLKQVGGMWMARHTGPHSRDIVSLFGTDTLPTPFSSSVPVRQVVAELLVNNPGANIKY